MRDTIEIKKEMSIILGNTKLPIKVKNIIKGLYAEYQYSYKKLIQALKNKYPNKEKEISKIELDTLEDYNGDIEMTELLEFEEYEQKRTRIVEIINSLLNDINKNKGIAKAILSESEKKVTNEAEIKKSTNIIINNAIDEIESSGMYVLNKINYLELPKSEELNQIKQQFQMELKKIKEDGISKTSEMAQALKQHFNEIYEQLANIIDMYENDIRVEKMQSDDEER